MKKGTFVIFLWHPNLLLVNREYVRNISLFFVWLKAESLSEESCKLLWVASCPAFTRCNTHTPCSLAWKIMFFYLESKAKEGKQQGPPCKNWGIFFPLQNLFAAPKSHSLCVQWMEMQPLLPAIAPATKSTCSYLSSYKLIWPKITYTN